jgi:cytochrome c556
MNSTARRISRPTLKARFSVIAATTALLGAAAAVLAATPQETQKIRHEHYEKLGEAFKAVRDNSRGSGDFAALEKAAAVIQEATVNQIQWFPKGSGPEAGKTRALPEIWSKPDEFAAAQKVFEDRAPALTAAVKAKDLDAVSKAFRELGGACKNCHDNFRAPE